MTPSKRGVVVWARVGFACLVLLGVGRWGQADPTKPAGIPVRLSLEDAVFMSLKNNGDLALQQYGPAIAGAFEKIERGEYDPQLFVRASHARQNTTENSRSTSDQFDVDVRQTDAVAGLVQRTPLGTAITTSVSADRNSSSRTPVQYGARLGLSLTQQLLRGFGPKVNLAGLRIAELETLASRHELKGYAQTLVAEVETAYWQYVSATEAIAVFEKSLEVAQTQLADVEARIAVGTLPENEAAAARSEVALRNQSLIDAQSKRKALRYRLWHFISPPTSKTYSQALEATSEPSTAPAMESNLDELLELALKSRPEIAEATLRYQQGELETVVTRNGLLPKLELFIDLGKTSYAGSFSRSFAQLDGPTYDAAAGIEFSHTLGHRAARARRDIKTATAAQAKQAIENLRAVVCYDIHVAFNELERSHQQLAASSQTRLFREQTLQSMVDKFEVGTATGLVVAQAQRDLLESQINEIEGLVDYQIAKVQLYLAEGTLLERRGLVLGE